MNELTVQEELDNLIKTTKEYLNQSKQFAEAKSSIKEMNENLLKLIKNQEKINVAQLSILKDVEDYNKMLKNDLKWIIDDNNTAVDGFFESSEKIQAKIDEIIEVCDNKIKSIIEARNDINVSLTKVLNAVNEMRNEQTKQFEEIKLLIKKIR